MKRLISLCVGAIACFIICAPSGATERKPKAPVEEAGNQTAAVANKAPQPGSRQYEILHKKIASGNASLAEVRMALSEPEPLILSNVMQALYSMRWHRGVLRLLEGLWTLEQEKYPELAWTEIGQAPTRIALASTINRIKIVNTAPYQDYIRQYINSEDNLIGAQAAVGLGFNGDPKDLPSLQKLGGGENAYIAQSAITGLGLFGSHQARDALIELLQSFKETNRGQLIREVLKHAYKWPPPPQYNPLPPTG